MKKKARHMSYSEFLIDEQTILVADASVVINLNATDRAIDIIHGIPGSIVVTENALAELTAGEHNGHSDSTKLLELIDIGAVGLVKLGEREMSIYTSLVAGSAARTLDDGEAATIAYAVEAKALALIDERKARKLCINEYPSLPLASTVDLFLHSSVRRAIGERGLIEVLIRALRIARMRVPSHQIDMVIELIGEEAAVCCKSLPKTSRSALLPSGRP